MTDYWANGDEIEKLGLTAETHVVVYDSLGIFSSPRGVFTFKGVCSFRGSIERGRKIQLIECAMGQHSVMKKCQRWTADYLGGSQKEGKSNSVRLKVWVRASTSVLKGHDRTS